jgi:signal peptidase I
VDGEHEQTGWPPGNTAPAEPGNPDLSGTPAGDAPLRDAPLTVPAGAKAAHSQEKKRRTLATVLEIVVIVAAAFAIAMLVQAFLVKPFTIHQVSMEPTLNEGDRILINRLTYHFRAPKTGDVIVFHSPVTQGEDLVKRVIAVGGDTLAISQGKVYVNGVALSEPYLLEQGFAGDYPEIKIPEGQLFVMGDNRNNSGDSRFFGPIDRKAVIGCAFVVYWPIKHWRGL